MSIASKAARRRLCPVHGSRRNGHQARDSRDRPCSRIPRTAAFPDNWRHWPHEGEEPPLQRQQCKRTCVAGMNQTSSGGVEIDMSKQAATKWWRHHSILVSELMSSLESFDGGRCRIRTYDLLIKSQLLYQLSSAPIKCLRATISRRALRVSSKGPPPCPPPISPNRHLRNG